MISENFNFVKFFIFLVSSFILLSGIYNLYYNIEKQKCSMTYMWEFPDFKRHFPVTKSNIHNQRYGLYYYSEGGISLRMKGVPVLFIPGNSGSFKQVRSFASVSLRMSLKDGNGEQLFDYFTVDLNEELSALSGTIVNRQMLYVDACLTYISFLYGSDKNIIIIGHSMGALVARAVVVHSPHPVTLIIALASPLEIPIISIDPEMTRLYRDLNQFWTQFDRIQSIVLISITGGSRDLLVWDGYGRVNLSRHAMWLPALSLARTWTSTDHLSIVWCRELVIALNKAMYNLLTLGNRPAPTAILSTMDRHLQSSLPSHPHTNISIDHYYRLLFQPTVISLTPAHNQHLIIYLRALTSASRPLRIKVTLDGCPTSSGTKVTLYSTDNSKHMHKYIIQDEPEMLSLALSSADRPSAHVEVDLSSHCHYTITVYASVVDWATQLIRIHAGRAPSFIGTLTITLYTHSYTHILLSLPLLLSTTLLLSSYSASTSNLVWIQLYTDIDIVDIVFILVLCLPLAWLLFTIARAVTAVFGRLPDIPLLLILLILGPLIGLLSTTLSSLANFALLLLHLLTVSRTETKLPMADRKLLQGHTVTMIILIVFLLEIGPLFAEFHSQIQHDSLVVIFGRALRELSNHRSYSPPPMRLLSTIVIVMLRLTDRTRTSPKSAPSMIVALNLWLASIMCASWCLVFGAVDTSVCGTCLVAAMVMVEVCDHLRPRDCAKYSR